MQSFLIGIDYLNAFVGKVFSWSIVALTGAITYEVFARYLFNAPTEWAYDISYMLYGTLFMMAGAYTLSRNGHVRGDFIYRSFSPRTQAKIDALLYILFFFPGMMAFVWTGYNFFYMSYIINEHSSFSPFGPIIWPFKALIPIAGFFMILQGVAEVIRCLICIRRGEWPPRLADVEELENVILAKVQSGEIKVPD